MKQGIPRRAAHKAARSVLRISNVLRRRRARRNLNTLGDNVRLHLGCGPNKITGWVNIDIDRLREPDLRHDLRVGLPARRRSVSLIYSEHVVEHLPLSAAERLFFDCHDALVAGGVFRVAMPDLEVLVSRYMGDWWDQDWITTEAVPPASAAEMLNLALRGWGHQYVYDFSDLEQRLRKAGFVDIRRMAWGVSDHPELCGLETRADSLLVVEATARD